jgi:sulfite exporter TauE/SafE
MDINPLVISSTPYITAFLTGLLGGVHCLGMCGGISAALTQGLAADIRHQPRKLLPFTLVYNSGRILSYTLAGAIVGYLGFNAGSFIEQYQGWIYLRIVAGLFMIVLGLYLGGWWFGLLRLERLGGKLWQRISGLTRRLLPVNNLRQAFSIGILWGWLPCGLVYSMLIFSFAAGGWLQGAGFMISFGLGTLPVLMATGLAAGSFALLLRKPLVRHMAGALVITFGIWTIAATLLVQANVGLGCAVPAVQSQGN